METPLDDVIAKAKARRDKAKETLLRAKTLKLGESDPASDRDDYSSTAAPETPTSAERGAHMHLWARVRQWCFIIDIINILAVE